MAIECKHGQLARKCYICELEAEVASLKEALEGARTALERIAYRDDNGFRDTARAAIAHLCDRKCATPGLNKGTRVTPPTQPRCLIYDTECISPDRCVGVCRAGEVGGTPPAPEVACSCRPICSDSCGCRCHRRYRPPASPQGDGKEPRS